MNTKEPMLEVLRDVTDHVFPSHDNYGDSFWSVWETRIEYMHDKELEWIEDEKEVWKGAEAEYIDLCTRIANQSTDVTNSMYAALVISIWAKIEFMNIGIARLLAALPENKASECYKFPKFESSLKEKLNIDINQSVEHVTVNAIRELNNCFKHNHGSVKPGSEKYQIITNSPTTRKALPENESSRLNSASIKIEYSELPIPELISACNRFYCDLLNQIQLTPRP